MKLHRLASATAVLLTTFFGSAAASSLRGRVAVNSDSVDSEDYYYLPEVEDYEFAEEEGPEDLDDEDMELYVKYLPGYPGQGIGKEIKHATRYAENRAKKAAAAGDYYGVKKAMRQAESHARDVAREYGYGRHYDYRPRGGPYGYVPPHHGPYYAHY